MPYIDNAKRIKYEKGLQDLLNVLRKVPKENVDGELNYVITRILRGLYGPGYYEYNRAIGVLESVKQEYYRRVVSPYEDKKIKEKGDV